MSHTKPLSIIDVPTHTNIAGDPMAMQHLAFPDRRLEAPWRGSMAAQRLQSDRVAMAVLAAALLALGHSEARGALRSHNS